MKNKGLYVLLGLALLAYFFRDQIEEAIMRITDEGLNLIRRFEGFSATVYNDIAGRATIGYGHLLKPGESFTSITPEEAKALLRGDVESAEQVLQRSINPTVHARLSPSQHDALVSLVYNIGGTNFAASTLLKKLNAGDLDGAADQFLVWNKARQNGQLVASSGLTNRRMAERDLFNRA